MTAASSRVSRREEQETTEISSDSADSSCVPVYCDSADSFCVPVYCVSESKSESESQ